MYIQKVLRSPFFQQGRSCVNVASRSFASARPSTGPTKKDYYSILDIPYTATAEQIKDAYRTQVKKYHPDSRLQTGKGEEASEEKFREVTEAY